MSRLLAEVERALRRRDGDCVITEPWPNGSERRTSGTELRLLIDEWERFFRHVGVRPGDRVALVLINGSCFVAVFLALLRCRAVPAALKTDQGPFELCAVAENLAPSVLVVSDALQQRVLAHFPNVRLVVDEHQNVLRAGPAVAERDERAAAQMDGTPDAPDYRDQVENGLSINYTYRGYGYPLGAMVPAEQYRLGADVFAAGMAGRGCRRMLVILPMAHIFTLVGCVFVPLLHDIVIHIAHTMHPGRLWQQITEQKIDFLTLVPELALMLSRYRPSATGTTATDRAALDIVATGGSRLVDSDYLRIREALGAEVLHGYGLTEFTPVSRNIRGSARAGTVGPPGEGVAVRIAGIGAPSRTESDARQTEGEIQLRTVAMASGYFRRPAESAAAVTPDGWFRTGDIGRLDDGHLVFVRENKRTCKVNGAMVDLSEVSRALESCPEVASAQTEYRDGALQALLVPAQPDMDVEQAVRSVRLRMRETVAAYKIPRNILFSHR